MIISANSNRFSLTPGEKVALTGYLSKMPNSNPSMVRSILWAIANPSRETNKICLTEQQYAELKSKLLPAAIDQIDREQAGHLQATRTALVGIMGRL